MLSRFKREYDLPPIEDQPAEIWPKRGCVGSRVGRRYQKDVGPENLGAERERPRGNGVAPSRRIALRIL